MIRPTPVGMGLLAGLCAAPGLAMASEPGNGSGTFDPRLGGGTDVVSVRDRSRDEFKPDGIRIGNYLLFSEIGFRTTWTGDSSKLYGGDLSSSMRFQPDLAFELKSQFQRHQFDIKTELRPVGLEDGEVRTVDGLLRATWRIDIDHSHNIFGQASTELRHDEDLEDERSTSQQRRSSVLKSRVETGLARNVGRIEAAVGARYQRWDYGDLITEDGAHVDQSAQDYSLLQPFVRLGYRLSPGYRVFSEIAGRLQENRGDGTIDRDARGAEAHAGVEFELSPVIRLMLKAGYVAQDYLQPGLTDIGAMVWNARAEWLVTPLLTISVNSQRNVEPTGFGEASGRLIAAHTIRADYEVWRNLLVSAEAGLRTPEYIGDDRRDTIWLGRLGAEYMAGKNWFVSLSYEHQQMTSNYSEFDRTLDKITFGVKYRY